MAECLRQGFIQKWPTYVEETIGDIYVWKLYVSVAAKSTRRGGWEEETLTREKEKVCKLLPPPPSYKFENQAITNIRLSCPAFNPIEII